MRDAQRDPQVGAPEATTETADAAGPEARGLEQFRQIVMSRDVPVIAKYLRDAKQPRPLIEQLVQWTSNSFVQQVLATKPEPSLWQRISSVEDGHHQLVNVSKDASATAATTDDPAPSSMQAAVVDPRAAKVRDAATAVIGTGEHSLGEKSFSGAGTLASTDKTIEHAHAISTAGAKVGESSTAASGTASASVDGMKVGGNANASVQVFGGQAAIHSKPMTHELLGETVSAQFSVGVDAQVFAEAKGQLGMEVGWTGLGAHAHLSGLGNSAVNLTGAASLQWSKRSPAEYAAKIAQYPTWRTTLARLLPPWLIQTVPDAKLTSWLTSLVELVIAGGGGDAVVLGASTSAGARGALGLPEVSFEGGSLHTKGSGGLTFGGSSMNVDLELGKARGLELMSVLAFRGTTGLLEKIAPSVKLPEFLRERLGASSDAMPNHATQDDHAHAKPADATHRDAPGAAATPSTFRDKVGKLDKNGNNSLVNWSHDPDGASAAANTKGEGHDFTITKAKGATAETHTGDAARARHAEYSAQDQAEAAVPVAGKAGKVKDLAAKALGDGEKQLGHKETSTSVRAVDRTNVAFGTERIVHGDVNGRALELEAGAGGDLGISADKLRVGGNAHASAYLVGAQVQLATPDIALEMFGERVTGKFNFGVDAGVFAEANGNVNVDVGFKGGAISADVSGFVGAKAGLTANAALTWSRKSAQQYADQIVKSGNWRALLAGYLPASALEHMPDKKLHAWMEKLVSLIMHGDAGDALVLGASARAEGSIGVGAAGALSAGFRGGVMHVHGRGGLSFGLGAGANVDLALGLTDGMALLGILTMRGATELPNMLRPGVSIREHVKPYVGRVEAPTPKSDG